MKAKVTLFALAASLAFSAPQYFGAADHSSEQLAENSLRRRAVEVAIWGIPARLRA
jgi:hypothetical protein